MSCADNSAINHLCITLSSVVITPICHQLTLTLSINQSHWPPFTSAPRPLFVALLEVPHGWHIGAHPEIYMSSNTSSYFNGHECMSILLIYSSTKEGTWQDTLKEDLDTLGVDWSDARDTANDRARWRQLVKL